MGKEDIKINKYIAVYRNDLNASLRSKLMRLSAMDFKDTNDGSELEWHIMIDDLIEKMELTKEPYFTEDELSLLQAVVGAERYEIGNEIDYKLTDTTISDLVLYS